MSPGPRPLGDLVSPASPAEPPTHQRLVGRFVTLTQLLPEHAHDLFPLVSGASNAWLFDYTFDLPPESIFTFQASMTQKSQSKDPLFFAIIDNASSKAVGWLSLMRIDPANRAIEVGSVHFAPVVLQRTPGATESIYLLGRLVFDDLGYRRFEWKCNALNASSRRAAERLGFSFEGIFRKHMIAKGRNRDTAWFSIVDDEWPVLRNGFEKWLAPDNFDENGQQRAKLEDLRAR